MVKSKLNKKSGADLVFAIIITVVMSIFVVSYLFMFVWMLLNSFRNVANYNANPMAMLNFKGVDSDNVWGNYKKVFEYTVRFLTRDAITGKRKFIDVGFVDMFKNSLIQITISLIGGIIFPPAVGYVISKYDFKGKRIIEIAVLITMCIPTIGTTVAVIKFYDMLGIMNTWWTVILSKSGGLGFGVLLYGNYFGSIPRDYLEAAKIEGAGNLYAYIKIMFPLAVPILVAQGILTLIASWNDYMTSFLYLKFNPTVAYGINLISLQYSNAYPVVFSALFMTSAVTLIIFAIFNKKLMSNMSVGGVKG